MLIKFEKVGGGDVFVQGDRIVAIRDLDAGAPTVTQSRITVHVSDRETEWLDVEGSASQVYEDIKEQSWAAHVDFSERQRKLQEEQYGVSASPFGSMFGAMAQSGADDDGEPAVDPDSLN